MVSFLIDVMSEKLSSKIEVRRSKSESPVWNEI